MSTTLRGYHTRVRTRPHKDGAACAAKPTRNSPTGSKSSASTPHERCRAIAPTTRPPLRSSFTIRHLNERALPMRLVGGHRDVFETSQTPAGDGRDRCANSRAESTLGGAYLNPPLPPSCRATLRQPSPPWFSLVLRGRFHEVSAPLFCKNPERYLDDHLKDALHAYSNRGEEAREKNKCFLDCKN